MEHILQQIDPSIVTIDGIDFPLLFTMRAAAEMEQELGMPYLSIISEIMGTGENGDALPPMPWHRQAAVFACLIRAGGVNVTVDELLERVHMSQAQTLANAALLEMLRKLPTGKAGSEKNG